MNPSIIDHSQISNTLGIDFGTSNSAVGVCVKGKPHLVAIENGDSTLPTSIFFDSEERTTRYGRAANRSLIEHDTGRFMRALKSVLGTRLMHEKRYLLGKQMTFVDIIARFLNEVKTRAEAELDHSFDYAVSGRPVHFYSDNIEKDAQAHKDLTQCYLAAGFKGVEFLYEPEAAALSYGGTEDGKLSLLVDIGGGTSDFCLFKSQTSGIEVLACSGARIGGTNFDKTLSLDHIMPLLGHGQKIRIEMGDGILTAPNAIFQDLATWERIPSLYARDSRALAKNLHKLAVNPKPFSLLQIVLEDELGHDIAFASERGKIRANETGTAEIELSFLEADLSVPVTRDILTHSLQQQTDHIAACALETLTMAQCSPNSIDQVIFVGGSSLMGVVRTTVASHFPQAQMLQSNAFTAIVDGLAIASQNY